MPDIIENTAAIFANQTEKIRQAIINELVNIYTQGGDPILFAEQMLKANFNEHIIRDLGFGANMDSLFAEYDKIAGGVAKTFGSVSAVTVNQLKNLDSLFFMEHVRDVGEALTRQMVYAAYMGITESALKENLLNATKKLSEAQIGSLTNTALRTFSRGIFAITANELAPKDAKFMFNSAGLIPTSRDFCIDHVGQTFTLEEAQALSNYEGGSAWIEGGGFNCRHSWTLVT